MMNVDGQKTAPDEPTAAVANDDVAAAGQEIRPIDLMVLGVGNRSTWLMNAVSQSATGIRIVGLVDPIASRRTAAQNAYQLNHVPSFGEVRESLKHVHCDAVAVFTPDGQHAEPVIAALEAGKHVFVEKPLEVTQSRMQAILDADDRAGGRTFVGLNLRYAPVYRRARQLIDDGTVGPLLTVQADEFYFGGRTYFRRWNRFREHGGGLWITKSCHDFDLIQWLVGARPISVSAASSLSYYTPKAEAAMYCRDCRLAEQCPDRYDRFIKPGSVTYRLNEVSELETGHKPDLCVYNAETDTFDHGTAMIRYEDGVTACYTLNVVSPFTNRRLRVAGTKAVIDGDMEAMTVTVHPRDHGEPWTEDLSQGALGSHGGADGHVLQAFVAFVRGEQVPVVSPREAAMGVLLGLAAESSCQTGQACAVPDLAR